MSAEGGMQGSQRGERSDPKTFFSFSLVLYSPYKDNVPDPVDLSQRESAEIYDQLISTKLRMAQ